MLTLNPVDEQVLEEAACHALWGGEGLGKPAGFRLGGGQEELVEVAEKLESGSVPMYLRGSCQQLAGCRGCNWAGRQTGDVGKPVPR